MINTKKLNIQYNLDGKLKFRHKVLLLVAIVALSATFLMPEIVKAGTHYVSPTGSASWANSTKIETPSSVTTAEQNADDGDIVLFRGGTYSEETITPSNSGSSGNRIVFQAYTGETPIFDGTKTVGNAIVLDSRDYITIDGLTIRRYTGAMIRSIHRKNLSEYLTIQNCTIKEPAASPAKGLMLKGRVTNVDILNNTIDFSSGTDDGLAGIVIQGYQGAAGQVTHTRIEGNEIIGCGSGNCSDAITIHTDGDGVTNPGNYHLIKDNTIYSWKENCVDIASASEYIVVTGNTLYDGYAQVITGPKKNRRFYDNDIYGVNNWIGSEWIYGGSTTWTDGGTCQIINNRFWGRGNGLMLQADTRYVYDVYIAHNTFDGTDGAFGNNSAVFHIRSTDSSIDNVNLKNNIYYYKSGIVGINLISNVSDTKIDSDYNLYYETTNSPGANVWIKAGKGRTLSYVQDDDNYDQENSKFEDNPDFTNAAANDYTLQDGSPAINAGGWLTTITSGTGSGTTFNIADPLWFYDGWNIIGEKGDTIKTENGQSATITLINYDTGEITVDKSISWTNGEGIGLDYEGIRPDIGAKEVGILAKPESTVAMSSPKGFKVTCTSDEECGEGYSCWYAIPSGPSHGIPGSKENPGSCWHNDIILQTF